MSVPKVPEPDQATSACAKNKEGPKPGEQVRSIACTLNGLGILCPGMCYRRFAILSRAPNGVSNEHFRSERIF